MRFIGDIHANMKAYLTAVGNATETIQVGDFGMGFYTPWEVVELQNMQRNEKTDHRFIRGNHDDKGSCRGMPGWISDGTYYPHLGMMCVGGAESIDKDFRTPGVDWWPDEELSYRDFSIICDAYSRVKPAIMVTHDAPHQIAEDLFRGGTHKPVYPTHTSSVFQAMLDIHRPDLWIFGHWHMTRRERIQGTDFICLDINEALDIAL